MPGDRSQEVLALERVQPDAPAGSNGRRARHVVKERDLTEMVAAAERGHVRGVHADVDLAVRDRVEAVAESPCRMTSVPGGGATGTSA